MKLKDFRDLDANVRYQIAQRTTADYKQLREVWDNLEIEIKGKN